MATGGPDDTHRLTTPAVLYRMAFDHADDAAVLTDERRLTFAELHQEVRHTAAALAGLGVHPGDRVAIWLPNTWHWVVACLAIHYAGGVVVPINPMEGDVFTTLRTLAEKVKAARGQ